MGPRETLGYGNRPAIPVDRQLSAGKWELVAGQRAWGAMPNLKQSLRLIGKAMGARYSGLRLFKTRKVVWIRTPFFARDISLETPHRVTRRNRITWDNYDAGPHDVYPRRGPGELSRPISAPFIKAR